MSGGASENRQLREQLERLSQEVLRGNERIRELESSHGQQEEIQRLKEEIEELKSGNKHLNEKLSHHKSAQARLRMELQELQRENEQLQSKLQDTQGKGHGTPEDIANNDAQSKDEDKSNLTLQNDDEDDAAEKEGDTFTTPQNRRPKKSMETFKHGLLKDHQPMEFAFDSPFIHSQEMYIESRFIEISDFIKEAVKLMSKYIESGQDFQAKGEALANLLQRTRYRSWCSSIPTLHYSFDVFAKLLNEIQSYLEIMLLSFQGSFVEKLEQFHKTSLDQIFASRRSADSARVEAENVLNRLLSIKRGNQADNDADFLSGNIQSDLQSSAKGALARGVKWLKQKREEASGKVYSKQPDGDPESEDLNEINDRGKPSNSSLTLRLQECISALKKAETTRFEAARKIHLGELEKRSSFVDATCGCLYAARAYFEHISSYLSKVSEDVRMLQMAAKDTLDLQTEVGDIWQSVGSELNQELAKTYGSVITGRSDTAGSADTSIANETASEEDPHTPLDSIFEVSSNSIEKLNNQLSKTYVDSSGPVSPLAKLQTLEQNSGALSPTLVQISKSKSKQSSASTNYVKPVTKAQADKRSSEPGRSENSNVVKCGYLWKLSSGMLAQWQRRWFYVRDGKLWYLRGPHDVSPQLICELVVANIREISGSGDANDNERTRGIGIAVSQSGEGTSTQVNRSVRPYVFEIQTPQRKPYLLQAISRYDQRDWVSTLRKHAEALLVSGGKKNGRDDSTIGGTGGYGGDTSRGIGNTAYDPTIREIQERNPVCGDCDAQVPDWASVNIGILLCLRCSGIHRSLGTHISKVKSLTLDSWDPATVSLLKALGNKVTNFTWEYHLPQGWDKPSFKSEHKDLEKWIRAKYEWRGFVPQHTEDELLDKLGLVWTQRGHQEGGSDKEVSFHDVCSFALFMCAGAGSIDNVQLCLALKADVNWKWEPQKGYLRFKDDSLSELNERILQNQWSVLHAAVYGSNLAVVEYLLQNGATITAVDAMGLTALEVAQQRQHLETASEAEKTGEVQTTEGTGNVVESQDMYSLLVKRLRDTQL